MFTGLVEECGMVKNVKQNGRTAYLTIDAPVVREGTEIGDSIAVNGCCLTVVRIDGALLSFEAVAETMQRTNLGALKEGTRVNLERSLSVGGRLGGHFVQGHVDGPGVICRFDAVENAVVIDVEAPVEIHRYFVEKGSVALDGVSLTIAALTHSGFSVWTIPHTREVTTLGTKKVGDTLNIECDLLGKYVARLLDKPAASV